MILILINSILAFTVSGNVVPSENLQIKTATTIREKSFDLLSSLVKYDQNIVLSPLSIMGAMYMLAAGSAGNSRAQILETLNFGDAVEGTDVDELKKPFESYKELITRLRSQPEKGYILDIANGLFHQQNMSQYSSNKINNGYVDLLKESFIQDVSNIIPVDFAEQNKQTTELINDWVNNQTRGKIPALFEDPISSDTLVIFASTLYFKASWDEKFRLMKKSSKTAENLCWATSIQNMLDSQCTDIQWMEKEATISHATIMLGAAPIATIIDLPLRNKKNNDGMAENKWMMQIWLPQQYITSEKEDQDFRKIIKENIGEIRKKKQKQLSHIIMPKFKIDFKSGLIGPLKNLGITDVFSESADLTPMLGNDHFAKVSAVDHVVNFNVDENGIEGAAVTSIQITARTFHQPKLLLMNKPFYFVISNRCWRPENPSGGCDFGNVPLFIGRVVNPET